MRDVVPSVSVVVMALIAACSSAGAAWAQGTPEQREACTPDALKFCAATIPDVAKTTECMKAHRADLSPRCQATLAAGSPARADAKRSNAFGRPAAQPDDGERREAQRFAWPDARDIRDPDAEISYTPPRRVIAPPLYSDPGPPLNPGGVPYDELFAGPTIFDIPSVLDGLDDPPVD